MIKTFRPAIVLFVAFTVLTGLVYPLVMTGLAQAIFPHEANGSLVVKDGKVIGSSLIGQNFSDNRYFWSRPSATSPQPNNAANSGASNLGPTNSALTDAVKARIDALKAAGPVPAGAVPVDLVTASASGLDPDISPAAAYYQVLRVAAVRKLPADKVKALVDSHITPPQWGFLGEARVNVLQLNLDLDRL
ncbi:MAG: potassium-transporting ATPase subunit KdpC [Paludibacterium sp.]|uniref:potassium-transporting ATPase subunit KdpC n=1 Tax=Paludibacterium sp. TaxID=1917523 RepID=UPI0025FFFA95|nr:potassium-transporting ATPase subunit KdpC [Paludibacterium sp.]MBV8047718.1 potassium-transporting ATPase subunit KdpC [Paludibacterium sp.]MBV8648299.1 potassium-transporting ATPase subunit KdpC [Paludibacterium sp.]